MAWASTRHAADIPRQDIIINCLVTAVGADRGSGLAVTGAIRTSHRSSIDEAKPENVKAMVEFTRSYGVYA